MDEYKGICGARPEGLVPEEQPDLTGIFPLIDELPDYNTLLLLLPNDTNTARLTPN